MKPKRVRLVRVIAALSVMISLLYGFVQTPTAAAQGPVKGQRPVESHLVKAHTFTGDVRKLPHIKPVKQERPEFEDPVANPIPLPDASATNSIEPSRPSTSASLSRNEAVSLSVAGFVQKELLGKRSRPKAPAPAPNITFDGLDFATWGAGHPPDTNGDVGPTYYIQTVNTAVGIYNKATGSQVAAFTFNTLMSQGSFGNLCDTNNFGDPVVLYDTFEDRWVITDFAFTLTGSTVNNPPGAFQCFAVSRSGDPVSGGWNFYSINTTGGLGDYPKFGIWPDGLYMSTNMFTYAGSFMNPRVYAFNKAQMYAGASSVQVVSFDAPSADFTLLPSNARLQAGTPPAGSPNYFISTWEFLNALTVYKFHVNWNSISTSTFTGPDTPLNATSWPNAAVANATSPANALDVLQIRAMVQNQYSNIGGVESLWTAHTVRRANTAGFAAPRYYQVNVTGGTVAASTVQGATFDPDGANVIHRFMPSVAVDRIGDMALGYTASSTTVSPSIRYAGRLVGDAVNTLPQTEQTLLAGTASQSGNCGGSACIRWGDYSAMTLDPDGCTFWYTNEYYTATNSLNDLTRIGSFNFPSCTTVGNGAISGTVIDAGSSNPLSGVTVTLGSRITTTNGSGIYQFSNLPAGVYPSIAASYPGYTTGSAGPITVTENLTTTQDFSLTTSATANCYIDTTQADFQTGVSTNCDLTSSPGDVSLANATHIDSFTGGTTTGTSFATTSWGGQTFIPTANGSLTQADVQLFSTATGTTPNLTVSIRATSGGLPTGSDLATATITGFSSGTATWYTANFGTPTSVTSGTQYALIVRPVSAPSIGGYFWIRASPSGYANGQRVSSADGGTTWVADSTRDFNFKAYIPIGYATNGNLVSSAKDANPSGTYTPRWTTLSWNATTPASTTIKFQAAASNSSIGPFSFVGPDGTSSTYFTSGASLSQFDGLRYLKYQASLSTTNSASTPSLADVTICFSNTAKITPTISIVSSQNPSLSGQPITFTASATSGAGTPSGQIQFKDNGSNLGAAQTLSSGSATIFTSTLPIGSHTITATYSGDAFFNANTGALAPDQVVTSTVTWNGSTSPNWFVAANWNPLAVPTTAASVIIPTAPSGNRWPILTGTATINDLTLQSSAQLTVSQGITLNVNGLVANNGTLAQIKDVPASTTTEFLHITDSSGTITKYHGVDLTLGSTALGVTTVQVKGNQSACTTNSADPIIQRCYQIEPTTQTTATVRFWFTEAERNAQPANTLVLWHWNPWLQVGTVGNYTYSESGTTCTSGGGQACWFQSTGVASYSPFALGSATAPTAITLRDFSAISSSSNPVFLIAVVLAAVTAIGAVAVSRKKRRVTLQ